MCILIGWVFCLSYLAMVEERVYIDNSKGTETIIFVRGGSILL